MPAARLDLSDDDIAAPDWLDRFRRALGPWAAALWDEAAGGFRQSEAIGANVLASSDVVWIRHAVGDPDLGAPDADRLVAFLQGAQDPRSGEVAHDPGPGGQAHSGGHACWQVGRALHLLGADWRTCPAALRGLGSAAALEAWFDARQWHSGAAGHHHEVLGVVPLVASAGDPARVEMLLRKVAEQRDPQRGTWPRRAPILDVSRTFAYTALHLAAGRLPEHAGRIVDAILDAQGGNGLWDPERPHFHTMDAAFLLVRLPPRLDHRRGDALAALRRLAAATREALGRGREAYASNPHAVLALTHTLGLLQEAFPDQHPSSPAYRFEWEVLGQYASAAIRAALTGPPAR
jgi:hypothetical protein